MHLVLHIASYCATFIFQTTPKTTVEVFYHGSRVASHRRLQTRQRDPLVKREHKLHILTFPRHDHDLNYMEYPLYGKISKGLRALFNTAQNI